jgi:acetyltransferase-like isoleucine patch superfamily enzyme
MGIKIGKDVYIGDYLCITSILGLEKNLTIEDRVSISPNVNLVLVSSPNKSRLQNNKNKYEFIDKIGKIVIQNDAWIGAGAIILPNVTIGEFSIVGAGSVVLKDVLPYTVVAGVPAKITRHLKEDDFI